MNTGTDKDDAVWQPTDGLAVITEQRETIKRLQEQLNWATVHYDSLREMHNKYYRETEGKLRHYLLENYEMEKQIEKLTANGTELTGTP